MLEVDPPYSISLGARGDHSHQIKGEHGYHQDRVRQMHGIFFANGPIFKKSMFIDSFQNINLTPFILDIFSVEYKDLDGSSKVLQKNITTKLR